MLNLETEQFALHQALSEIVNNFLHEGHSCEEALQRTGIAHSVLSVLIWQVLMASAVVAVELNKEGAIRGETCPNLSSEAANGR